MPILAVACGRCSHRLLIGASTLREHEGDRQELTRLPLVCRCGSAVLKIILVEAPGEAATFLAGHVLPPHREGRAADVHRLRVAAE